MSRTLYLHIGTEKTGTTFLQFMLDKNRALLNSNGYHYMQTGGSYNNRDIAAICVSETNRDDRLRELGVKNPEQLQALRDKIKREIEEELASLPESIHSVIASSEHFHSRTIKLEDVRNVYELLSACFNKVVIICYVREQSATAQSRYSTSIKAGVASSAAYKDHMSRCKPGTRYYNYHKMLSTWAEVFGKENVIIRKFDKKEMVDGDLFNDFVAQLGAGLELTAEADRDINIANESLNHFGLIVGMALNKTLPKFDINGSRDELRNSAFDKLYQHFKGKGKGIDAEEYKRLYNLFDESNRQLNRDFFGSDENFFAYNEPANSASNQLKDEMADGLAEVFAEVNRGIMAVADREADFLRDLALELEETDLEKAKHLVYLASLIKPEEEDLKEIHEKYRSKSAGMKLSNTEPAPSRGFFNKLLRRK